MIHVRTIKQPRCFLAHAVTPQHMSASNSNRLFNALVEDATCGLAIWHDHFIGAPSGSAAIHAENDAQRTARARVS
jgi:hypothetical protein